MFDYGLIYLENRKYMVNKLTFKEEWYSGAEIKTEIWVVIESHIADLHNLIAIFVNIELLQK